MKCLTGNLKTCVYSPLGTHIFSLHCTLLTHFLRLFLIFYHYFTWSLSSFNACLVMNWYVNVASFCLNFVHFAFAFLYGSPQPSSFLFCTVSITVQLTYNVKHLSRTVTLIKTVKDIPKYIVFRHTVSETKSTLSWLVANTIPFLVL